MDAPPLVLFFGTPEFAVPTLAALVGSGRAPRLVVSQPPRPVGRGRRLSQPPVARWALEHGLALAQPRTLREGGWLDVLAGERPDVAVVVAYGKIFPRRLLDLPRLGCVNLHASLLPRHRGAAPIQAALAAGDAVTGVSTMVMEEGLDTGPVLLQRETPIGRDERAAELAPRLAELGAALMVETLAGLERDEIEPRPQDETAATYAPRLTKEDGRVDWTLPARVLHDRWRAYTPWPGLAAERAGETVKILACEPLAGSADAAPGSFLGIEGERLTVACGGGSRLAVASLQRAGRRAVSGADYARGERLGPGDRFE